MRRGQGALPAVGVPADPGSRASAEVGEIDVVDAIGIRYLGKIDSTAAEGDVLTPAVDAGLVAAGTRYGSGPTAAEQAQLIEAGAVTVDVADAVVVVRDRGLGGGEDDLLAIGAGLRVLDVVEVKAVAENPIRPCLSVGPSSPLRQLHSSTMRSLSRLEDVRKLGAIWNKISRLPPRVFKLELGNQDLFQ